MIMDIERDFKIGITIIVLLIVLAYVSLQANLFNNSTYTLLLQTLTAIGLLVTAVLSIYSAIISRSSAYESERHNRAILKEMRKAYEPRIIIKLDSKNTKWYSRHKKYSFVALVTNVGMGAAINVDLEDPISNTFGTIKGIASKDQVEIPLNVTIDRIPRLLPYLVTLNFKWKDVGGSSFKDFVKIQINPNDRPRLVF